MSEDEETAPAIKLGMGIIDLLSRFAEVELEDVEMEIGELEISLQPAIPMPVGLPSVGEKTKPTRLLQAEFTVPRRTYPGRIIEVTLGATKGRGGSRSRTITIGGEQTPPYYLFEGATPNKPVVAFDVFDKAPPLSKVMKAPFVDVLDDPAAWAKKAVKEYGAEMVNLHLTSIDPLLLDTSPAKAAQTVERVLQAVDVPLSIGGCGDPKKDLRVFEKVAEVGEGERLLFNSITLDMDVQRSAEVIQEHGHTVIAFTSMDMAQARELNRRLYEVLEKDRIVMDTTTAALGYGLDYAFSIMERSRLAGLMGDGELQHPISSGTTNAWAAREAWMKMGPEWGPRELRGPIWETVTALTLLLAGVDYFMMMHPAAVKTVKEVVQTLMSGKAASSPTTVDWVSLKL